MPNERPGHAGFTLVELLTVMTLMIIVALLGLPALQNMIQRSKTEGVLRETATLMRLARIEGIKRGFPVGVKADGDEVVAWVDEDDDGVRDAAETRIGQNLVLPTGVTFSAPGGEPVVAGFGADKTVFFASDGSADDTGAFRFGDARGNYLEVRVEPAATARIEIKKWDGSAYRAQDEGGVTWDWK